MSIDLIWLTNDLTATAPLWDGGQVWQIKPTVQAVHQIIRDQLTQSGAEAWLFWHSDLGMPDADQVRAIAAKPGHVWHAGLKLGTGGKPGLFDYASPIWMFNADPDPAIEATSWRLSLNACLIQTEVLRQMGGIRPEFKTLSGAGLDLGLRWIRNGVFPRHIPDLIPMERLPPFEMALPIQDEMQIIRNSFPRRHFFWVLGRAAVTGYASPLTILNTLHRIQPAPTPISFRDPARYVAPDWSAARVSVLIPTLERYPYLRKLLTQMGEQTVAPCEVIVVDQTPADEVDHQLVSDYPDLPLTYIWQDTPGQCTSRNAGLQQTTGDYILMLDDDVEIPPDFIQQHLDNLACYRADASCGSIDEIGVDTVTRLFKIIRVSDVFPGSNTMMRREVLEDAGLFDLAYNRGQQADGDLGMRVYLNGCLTVYDPAISILHHRALRGGLREHNVRKITTAASRQELTKRRLPHMTEIYKMKRYHTPRQVHEALWGMGRGTLILHTGRLKRLVKVLIGMVMLPDTIRELQQRHQAAEDWLHEYPQIPALEPRQESITG